MKQKVVAVVGRPNVGKSTFFNKMAGRRVSIVNDMPGVTRDRLYADVEWCGHKFLLIDTGGIELKSEDTMWQHIRHQVELAVDTADVVLFVVDGRAGITASDYDVADYLRRAKKPVVLAVNKIDGQDNSMIYDFYQLNLGDPLPLSAEQSLGFGDLLDAVTAHFGKPDPTEEEGEEEHVLSIAVVGRPNAGKSSLVNKMLGYERVIVSDIAGTTRDAIDTEFEADGKRYKIVDTAGIRKKSKVNEDVEYYSVVRAVSAIRRADVVIVMVDATEGIAEQDVKIAGLVDDAGKPCIIAMNKWDAVEKDTHTIHSFENELKETLKFMPYFVPAFVSAKTGKRVGGLLEIVNKAHANASQRITTGILNDVIGDAIAVNEPPHKHGKKLKVFYATQVSTNPPTFVLFVNDPAIMHFSYKRYLENALRKAFDFSGTPIRILLRANDEKNS